MPGMGRGLEAILSASSEGAEVPAQQLRQLPVALMTPNPRQPRRRFEPDALQSLASSIEEQGLLQPVLVRALLIAEDHAERSRLAREAVREGWSVRALEARARESNGEAPRARITVRRARDAHPDLVQAAEEIGATLEAALGAEVRVTPTRE